MQQQLVDGSNALKVDFFDSIGIQLIPEAETFRSGMMPKNQILETFKRIDKLPFSNLDIRFSDEIWDFSQKQIYLCQEISLCSHSIMPVRTPNR